MHKEYEGSLVEEWALQGVTCQNQLLRTGQKADMRLLYRVVNIGSEDILQLLGVGFRHVGRPTLYDLASLRKEEGYNKQEEIHDI